MIFLVLKILQKLQTGTIDCSILSIYKSFFIFCTLNNHVDCQKVRQADVGSAAEIHAGLAGSRNGGEDSEEA